MARQQPAQQPCVLLICPLCPLCSPAASKRAARSSRAHPHARPASCCAPPPNFWQGLEDGLFNSRVYWGGPEAEDALTLLHSNPRRRLKGSAEVPFGELASGGAFNLQQQEAERAAWAGAACMRMTQRLLQRSGR